MYFRVLCPSLCIILSKHTETLCTGNANDSSTQSSTFIKISHAVCFNNSHVGANPFFFFLIFAHSLTEDICHIAVRVSWKVHGRLGGSSTAYLRRVRSGAERAKIMSLCHPLSQSLSAEPAKGCTGKLGTAVPLLCGNKHSEIVRKKRMLKKYLRKCSPRFLSIVSF